MSEPTPTCPPGSFYDANFLQCNRGLGSQSLAGPPTCPTGYLYVPHKCVKVPDPAATQTGSDAPKPTCPSGSYYIQMLGCMSAITGARQGAPTCPSGYVYTPPQWGTPGIGTCETDPAATSAAQQQAIAAATATAQASVDRYTLSFTALQGQKDQLQKTMDVMSSARGLYSEVSEDLHYSVNQFSQNISDIQNEINITNRKITPPSWWPWLDMFLNVLLVLVLLYAIYVVVTKVMYVRPAVTQIQYPY